MKFEKSKNSAVLINPGQFKPENHFYDSVLNTKPHSILNQFFSLTKNDIIHTYTQLYNNTDSNTLDKYLNYKPKYLKWAGTDLFKVKDSSSNPHMVVIETNTCPSGIKSMPLLNKTDKFGGYRPLIQSLYTDYILAESKKDFGGLAVIYDQNIMESSGYAATLAEISNEPVWLVEYLDDMSTNIEDYPLKSVKWVESLLYIRDSSHIWHPIRACIRFVTQKPWKKIPIITKTLVINPTVTCLAGGRNKILGAEAYSNFNRLQAKLNSGLSIKQPFSLLNVEKKDIPDLILEDKRFMGKAVVKVPYSNCGQGVYTILNRKELDYFMSREHTYNKFIIQSLIGHKAWSSLKKEQNEYFHIGTVPDENENVFVFDLRMVICANSDGFRPVSLNCRRARQPLAENLEQKGEVSSWDMLGTNLAIKLENNKWMTESERLISFSEDKFDVLGLDLNNFVDAYVQSVLCIVSIDMLCVELFKNGDGKEFDYELFKKFNPDNSLLNELN